MRKIYFLVSKIALKDLYLPPKDSHRVILKSVYVASLFTTILFNLRHTIFPTLLNHFRVALFTYY